MSIRPQLLVLGGYDQFRKYQSEFDKLYNGSDLLLSPLGYEVQFSQDSCAHVCFGGQGMRQMLPQDWHMARAARIPWIRLAIENPNCVHPDADHQNRRKHLLHFEASGLEAEEFYCVILREAREGMYAFLTAFDITKAQYRACIRVAPCLYSRPKTT